MSSYVRIAAIAVALSLPLLAFQLSNARTRTARLAVEPTVPESFGEWRLVRETRLEGESEQMLAPDFYTMRLYSAEGAAPVWIYAAFYPGVGLVGAHDPLVCYPAQGWTISERRQMEVDLPSGESLHAWFLRTELAGTEELVLYWFQPVGRWPAPPLREGVLRLLDRFGGHPQYAFVRLSLRRPPGRREVSVEDVETLKSMARAVAPWARGALRGGAEPIEISSASSTRH